MKQLDRIKAPINEHIQKFDKTFSSSMKSSIPLLDTITKFIVKRKGKQIRPMFVFLAAGLNGPINEKAYHASALIELLHTATLIHDDVVDESYKRRGFFSLNAIWKNKIAVLVGDFLLSKGLLLAMDNKEYDLLHIVSTATKEMSEGELLQIEKARRLDISEEIYFDIIKKKTASLIAACCAAGSAASVDDEQIIKRMHQFGEWVGIAFQIKDDLFDYQKNLDTGKPSGADIKEQKMTLPLIYILNHSDAKQKRWIINTVKRHNTDQQRVMELIKKVYDQGGIDYATQTMYEYRTKALDILKTFPENEFRNSLEELVIYTTERKK
ncbi:MAG: polyprenyl synthetase family protein [Bacteroidales bacterium]|nr:polyprenyl synthetase family protein [Bacteroidales bacterium]